MLDGETIISREFADVWAARVFAAKWSVGDFKVRISPA
jgi:hypothetical protein